MNATSNGVSTETLKYLTRITCHCETFNINPFSYKDWNPILHCGMTYDPYCMKELYSERFITIYTDEQALDNLIKCVHNNIVVFNKNKDKKDIDKELLESLRKFICRDKFNGGDILIEFDVEKMTYKKLCYIENPLELLNDLKNNESNNSNHYNELEIMEHTIEIHLKKPPVDHISNVLLNEVVKAFEFKEIK